MFFDAQAIFSIYGGSEGKITVASVKVSVLESAGLVTRNSAGTPSAEFCQKTVGHFIKVLETESTDTALVVALESFSTWVKKFRENAASSQLTDFLAKGLALKTSTSPVRSAYFQLILTAILSSGNPDAFKALAPTMLKVSTIKDASSRTIYIRPYFVADVGISRKAADQLGPGERGSTRSLLSG